MRRRLAAVASVIVVVAGCAQPYVRKVEVPVIPTPLVQKVPLSIGVHYTSEFRTARPVSTVNVPQAGPVHEMWLIGEPSVALFNSTLRSLFEEVIEVEQWPPAKEAPPVAGVLLPSVPAWGVIVSSSQYKVSYRLELYSTHSERLCTWDIVGVSGISTGELVFVLGKTMVRDAMRSAAARVVASFFSQPEARTWLEANGVHPDTLR
jgi:hypothetical protein